MARRLVNDGFKVTVITSSAFLDEIYDFHAGWNRLSIDGIDLWVLSLPYSNQKSFFKRIIVFLSFSVRCTFKSLSIKSDVVFATSTPLTIAIPGVIYSKLRRIPLVFEVRDLWPELPIAVGAIKNPIIIFLAKALEKIAYNNARKVVCLSVDMANGVAMKGKPVNEIVTIPNSCDIELFDVHPNIGKDFRATNLPFSIGNKLVVYTGTFGKINNLSYLVNLAKASLEYGYKITYCAIGTGMEKDLITELANNLGVLNVNLYLLEPVPKIEVVAILSAADMALSLFGPVPEMWANSANKMFDALAASTPIGINYHGWQFDLLMNKHIGVYLHHEDHEIAAFELNKFLNDKVRYKEAKNQAFLLAKNEFSRDNLYLKFKESIVKVVQ